MIVELDTNLLSIIDNLTINQLVLLSIVLVLTFGRVAFAANEEDADDLFSEITDDENQNTNSNSNSNNSGLITNNTNTNSNTNTNKAFRSNIIPL